jgi:hypothetical protein
MRRTLTFLENDPKAARVFYANIGYQLEIRSVSKLIVLFIKTLKLAVSEDVEHADMKMNKENMPVEQNVTHCTDEYGGQCDASIVVASNTKLMSEVTHNLITLLRTVSFCMMK